MLLPQCPTPLPPFPHPSRSDLQPFVAEPVDRLSSLPPFWGIFGESLALDGEKQKPRLWGP